MLFDAGHASLAAGVMMPDENIGGGAPGVARHVRLEE
jgi:hypothetical protein